MKFERRCKCEIDAWERQQERERQEQERTKIEKAFSMADLGPEFAEATFERWQPKPKTERVYEVARDYARNFADKMRTGEGLIIYSERNGNGKSYLAAAIINHIVPQGYTAIFRAVKPLFRRIQRSWDGGSVKESDIIDALCRADLLVLDDAGAERWTEWREETLYDIIDERWRWRRPIILTTNLKMKRDPEDSADKLVLPEQVGPRCWSRLLGRCPIVRNAGEMDVRLENARKQRAGQQNETGGAP